MYMDDNLDWPFHIKELSLQLAKSTEILYRLRNFIIAKTLRLLYYSLVYSRVQYEITLWGTATKTRLRLIEVKLNNIVLLPTWSRKYDQLNNL